MTEINQHLQDSFIRLAITDRDFIKLIIGQVNPKLFTSSIAEHLLQICFNYYKTFKDCPGDHFHDEVVRFLELYNDDEKERYNIYIKRIQELPNPNKDYILRRVGDFVRFRTLESAAIEFADLLTEGKTEQAQNVMYAALKSGIETQETGHRILRNFTDLSDRKTSPEYLVRTGIEAMDKLIGGFQRGQLISILGGAKGKKTWMLQHIAKTALLTGLKVLHISHEVSEAEMGLRYDMMFSARGSMNIGDIVTYPRLDEKENKLIKENIKIRCVYDTKAVTKARRAMSINGGDLIIKKYPMGFCTCDEIERYLNYLESYLEWMPDVIINDYVDIMNLPGITSDTRHALNRGYIWSKGITDDRNILMITASQATREAIQKPHASMKDFAEDIRKAAVIDLGIAICQTAESARRGTNSGRLVIIANRSGPMNVFCGFSFCLDIGQFCLNSWLGPNRDKEIYEQLYPHHD